MNKESKYISIIAISFTIAFIGCLICTGVIYSKNAITIQKEYEKVYVYVDVTSHTPELNEPDSNTQIYIVKEYFGQIGIFDEYGRLLETIEIYTKTLPKADRILLREGIKLSSREALDALIEDYSS